MQYLCLSTLSFNSYFLKHTFLYMHCYIFIKKILYFGHVGKISVSGHNDR